MKIKARKIVALLGIVSASLALSACHNINSTNPSTTPNNVAEQSNQTTTLNIQYSKLANLNFTSGKQAIIELNSNNATLNPNDWQGPKINFQNLDPFNRTSGSNTAFLSKLNVDALSSMRTIQYVKPSGWHINIPGKEIYNRGHLIAYSLSKGINKKGIYSPNSQAGDQNNPRNLFTQTAFANKALQTIFEDKVRMALIHNKKVIYQATPIFRGSELMARGIHLQAISTDRSLNFNVYIFNVQPGYSFNYQTGKATLDKNMYVLFNNQKINSFDTTNYHRHDRYFHGHQLIRKIAHSKIYTFCKNKVNTIFHSNQ